MTDVIEVLPTLLQAGLFCFLVGLSGYFWSFPLPIRIITITFASLPAAFVISTTSIAVVWEDSPFQTYISASIGKAILKFRRKSGRPLDPPNLQPEKDTQQVNDADSDTETSTTNMKVDNKDDSINLGCLTFFMEQLSREDDVKVALDALAQLPGKLDKKLSKQVGSLIEATVNYVLKPNWNTRLSKITWGTPGINFQRLLPLLHLSYYRWDYLPTMEPPHPDLSGLYTKLMTSLDSQTTEPAIRDELWRVAVPPDAEDRDTIDPKSAKLVADIIGARFYGHESPAFNVEDLIPLFTIPPTPNTSTDVDSSPLSDTKYSLPHIKLYAAVLTDTELDDLIKRPAQHRVVQALSLTMEENNKLDRDYVRGCLRIELFSKRKLDDQDKPRFSKYLLDWGTYARSRMYEANRPGDDVARKYLEGVYELLSSNDPKWASQLSQDTHPDYLSKRIKHYYDAITSQPNATSKATAMTVLQVAIYCFIILWKDGGALEDQSSIYMEDGTVKAILGFWGAGYGLAEEFGDGIVAANLLEKFMEHTALYLATVAKRQQTIDDNAMLGPINGYLRSMEETLKGQPTLIDQLRTVVDRPKYVGLRRYIVYPFSKT